MPLFQQEQLLRGAVNVVPRAVDLARAGVAGVAPLEVGVGVGEEDFAVGTDIGNGVQPVGELFGGEGSGMVVPFEDALGQERRGNC